jgi:hypothetical protein
VLDAAKPTLGRGGVGGAGVIIDVVGLSAGGEGCVGLTGGMGVSAWAFREGVSLTMSIGRGSDSDGVGHSSCTSTASIVCDVRVVGFGSLEARGRVDSNSVRCRRAPAAAGEESEEDLLVCLVILGMVGER